MEVLKAAMDSAFKFKIGDLVLVKAQKRGYEVLTETEAWSQRPQVCQVLERLAQQCHGGVQMHYLVRFHSANAKIFSTTKEAFQLTEPELELWVEIYK